MDPSQPDEQEVRDNYGQLDKLLEHRTRLTICALLRRYEQIAFTRFKQLLQETDGNLGAQLRKLEDAGYIRVSKKFAQRRPVSWYRITAKGKQALASHLAGLEALVATLQSD